jgi:Flp pilus assembly protein TadG
MGQNLLGRFAGARDGAMALEFALMAPLLMILLAGIIDVGAAINRQVQLTSAVQSGAQLAIARTPTAETLGDIEAAIRLSAPENANDSQSIIVQMFCESAAGVAASCSEPQPGLATYVAISLSETWAPTLSYPLHQRSLPLEASLTLRVR